MPSAAGLIRVPRSSVFGSVFLWRSFIAVVLEQQLFLGLCFCFRRSVFVVYFAFHCCRSCWLACCLLAACQLQRCDAIDRFITTSFADY